MERLISTLVWAAIFQGLLLAGMYLFNKKHRSLANRLLGFFLLVILFEGTLEFLPFDYIMGYPITYYFSLPEVKLFYAPLFLHYILEKVGRSSHYHKLLRFHYRLAFGIAGIALINILLFIIKGHKLEDYLGMETTEQIFMIQQYYAFVLIILAIIVASREVIRYKAVVQKTYSDYDMLNIHWLWQFIFAVLPIVILWGIELIRILLGGKDRSDIVLGIWGLVIIFIYFMSFQAFKKKNLFEGIGEAEDLFGHSHSKTTKRSQASLSPIQLEPKDIKVIQKIRHHMETHEPYLDASLSMYQLAQQLDMPVPDLSQLINNKLHKHFFNFVNEYRIKKAMEILGDPQNSKMTVLEVLYEVGFNSKSSFNTVFKKQTGKTPTQYRRSPALSEH